MSELVSVLLFTSSDPWSVCLLLAFSHFIAVNHTSCIAMYVIHHERSRVQVLERPLNSRSSFFRVLPTRQLEKMYKPRLATPWTMLSHQKR